MTIKIVDISYWVQNVNYDLFSAEVDGVILRGAYGAWKDKMLDTHYKEFTKRGVPLGLYHYIVEYRPASEQAQVFIGAAKDKSFKLGYWCDVELEKGATPLTRKTVDDYVALIDAGLAQMDFYSSRYYWDAIMKTDKYKTRKFWVAHYGAATPLMPATGGWDKWWLWQYSSSGKIPGATSSIDMNHFWGNADDFNEWVGEEIVVPPPLPNEPLYRVEVTANALNIRSGAGTNHGIVGLLRNGDIVDVYQEYAGWLETEQGWISAYYTIRVGDEPPPPPIEPSIEEKVERLWEAHPELH